MVASGWYYADGDDVGTKRYWDGARWIGDAVLQPEAGGAVTEKVGGFDLIAPPDSQLQHNTYGAFDIVPAGSQKVATNNVDPVPYVPATPAATDTGLRALVIGVCALKAVPLVGAAVFFDRLLSEETLGSARVDVIENARFVVFAWLCILGVALLWQLLAAVFRRPLALFIVALVLALLDLANLFVLGRNWVFMVIVGSITIAQVVIAFSACMQWIERRSLKEAKQNAARAQPAHQ